MKFAEELPDQCPPVGANDNALSGVYRLTNRTKPTEECFKSHAALGKKIPKSLKDECAWASCSLTTDPVMLKKLRKLSYSYAFKLEVPQGAGKHVSSNIHVHFWRSVGFDITSAVQAVEEI